MAKKKTGHLCLVFLIDPTDCSKTPSPNYLTKMTTDQYLYLSPHCRISRGYSRSLMIDFQRQNYWFVSNEWIDVLEISSPIKLSKFHEKESVIGEAEVVSFIDFLIDEELAFLTGEKPVKTNECSGPNLSTSTLSIEVHSKNPIVPIHEINLLRIENLSLYVLKEFSNRPNLGYYLSHYSNSTVKTVTLYIESGIVPLRKIRTLIEKNDKIKAVIISESSKNRALFHQGVPITYIKKNRKTATPVFRIDPLLYQESEKFHSYYNNTIHIDVLGNVKNAFETDAVFGNIHLQPLEDIISQNDFRTLRNVGKSEIDVCCDCEFSTICIDSRKLKKRGDGSWYAPQECAYNPYICRKVGDEGYFDLEECGIISEPLGFRIEVDRFIEIKNRIESH